MLLPLRTERRRAVLRVSLCAFAGALLLAPLAVPIPSPAGAGVPPQPVPAADPSFAQTPEPEVRILRDPFVPEAATVAADGQGASEAVAVEAIALGESPRALVRAGSATRIVRIGDALEDSRVSGIDARGVLLENGDVLPFAVQR
jgi:hypothetical protein